MILAEFLTGIGLRPVDGINALILLVVIWTFVRVVANEKNTIVWADFISSRGHDGEQRGDLTKVGQLVGIVVSAVTVLMFADSEKVEPVGLSALLGVALVYLGGVTAYSNYIRSKQGVVETSRTTEPIPDPAVTKTTETVTETPPIKSRR